MASPRDGSTLAARLIETLHGEAMLLADETRAYFDDEGPTTRAALSPRARIAFARESLKATTRLTIVIGWLLARRAIDPGAASERRLSTAAESDADAIGALPDAARRLVLGGIDLYVRVRRLDEGLEAPALPDSPARTLFRRLERAF